MSIRISTIIPVYNAERFLQRAVNSALQHNVVNEIILVDDGSTDKSAEICAKLEKEHTKVVYYQHEDGKNHGAGATRNLGLKKAKYEYISFLDVDDIYLENRFNKDVEIFKQNPDAEGVINALGLEVIDEEAKEIFDGQQGIKELTTFSDYVSPEEVPYVFYDLHPRVKGNFHLNGLTIKKSVLDMVGYFNKELRLHQDTEWFFRLVLQSRLYCGEIEKPVALRGIHLDNRVYKGTSAESREKLYTSAYNAIKELDVPPIFKLRLKVLIPYKKMTLGKITVGDLWKFSKAIVPYYYEYIKMRLK